MTFAELARRILTTTETEADHSAVEQMLLGRVTDLLNRADFRMLYKTVEIVVPKTLDVGSLSIESGTTKATLDAAASAAWEAAKVQKGRAIRIGSELTTYNVNGFVERKVAASEVATNEFVKNDVLHIYPPFTKPTVTGSSYEAVVRVIELPKDVRRLDECQFPRLNRKVRIVSQQTLNRVAPARYVVHSYPQYLAPTEYSRTGPRLCEIYPYPDEDEILLLSYYSTPPTFEPEHEIPPSLDEVALREATLIDVWRYNASKAASKGEIEKAAYWRNEYRAQETRYYSDFVPAAMAKDLANADMETVETGLGTGYADDYDPITTAEEDRATRSV